MQKEVSPAPSPAPDSCSGSPRRDGIFRYHAQLLAFTYYFQDVQIRRSLLTAHLGLVRKLSSIYIASPVHREGLDVLLAQCMALAEFMLRTLHECERTMSQAARLRSDIARLSHVPIVTNSSSNGGSSSTRGDEDRSRYLAVFEADDEAGVTAWHERPGAARAFSRNLCEDRSADGYAGWREEWVQVLEVASARRPGFNHKDSGHLFFSTWRLLGTLPLENLALGEEAGEPRAEGALRLVPGVGGMYRTRACLLGLQGNQQTARGDEGGSGDYGLLSARFSTMLSIIRTGLPGWLQANSGDLSKALVPGGVHRSTDQNELLSRQFRVHGLLETFAVYTSAAIAKAAQQGNGLGCNVAPTTSEDGDRSARKQGAGSRGASLVDVSTSLVELAEWCFRYHMEVVTASLNALLKVGDPAEYGDTSSERTEVTCDAADERNADKGGGGASNREIPYEMVASMTSLIRCNSVSKPMCHLAQLGCDQFLVGALQTELKYGRVEGTLENVSQWHRQACVRSTSRGSQSAGRLAVAFAEPDGIGPEFGRRGYNESSSSNSKSRETDAMRKWEVMANLAAWSTVRSTQALVDAEDKLTAAAGGGGGSVGTREDTVASDGHPTPTGTRSTGQVVDGVAECAAKLCLSARTMLEAVLISIVALTDALSSAAARADDVKRDALASGTAGRGGSGAEEALVEAWGAMAKRAVLLWGEISANTWCQRFTVLSVRSFEHLVRFATDQRDFSSYQEEMRCIVVGAWDVRRADALIRLALASTDAENEGDGSQGQHDAEGDNMRRVAFAEVALEAGLDELLSFLASPTSRDRVLTFYLGGSASVDVAKAPVAHARVAKAIAAAKPGYPTAAAGQKETATVSLGGVKVPGSSTFGNIVAETYSVPRGNPTTLTALLGRSDFSCCLPKVLRVLRNAMEAEARATSSPPEDKQHGRPLAAAVAHTLVNGPEDVIRNLVSWAVVAPRSSSPHDSEVCTSDDALVVLGFAVGYPGAAGVVITTETDGESSTVAVQQKNLRKRVFHSLVQTAYSWAGSDTCLSLLGSRASSTDGKKGIVEVSGSCLGIGGVAIDAAILSLWLASMEELQTELAVAVMGVARTLARRLQSPSGTDTMQVDGGETEELQEGPEEVGDDETVWSLARCLELMLVIFQRQDGSGPAEEADDTDQEHPDSVFDFTESASESIGKTTRRGVTTMATVAPTSPSLPQEPPLVCTFVSSHKEFVNQHWYHCYTCGLVNDKGCCRLCVRLCHRGHDVSYARLSCFFCDCGSSAAEGGGEEETPPPSLENSPASSSGAENLSMSSPPTGPSAGGPSSRNASAKQGAGARCDCLKLRTRRELNALLQQTVNGLKPTPSTRSARRPQKCGRRAPGSRRQSGAKKSAGSVWSPSQAARSRAKAAAAVVEAAGHSRNTPEQKASIFASLFGGGREVGRTGIFEDLRTTYATLLSRFDAVNAPGAVEGSRVDGNLSGGGRLSVSSKSVRPLPWDVLCESAVEAASKGGDTAVPFSPPQRRPTRTFLRCRPIVDARAPACYPVLAPARLMRNGSLDVRLPADGTRARQDRAAMALHGVVRRNLAASSCGKVAVAEAQSVLIVDPVGALALRYVTPLATATTAGISTGESSLRTAPSFSGAADAPVDRSHLCVVSSMAVGFDVVGLAFNPSNERHLVAWGLRNCCVLVLNSRGVAIRRVQVGDDSQPMLCRVFSVLCWLLP